MYRVITNTCMNPTRKSWLRLDFAHESLFSEVRVREWISKTLDLSVDVRDCVCTSVRRILNFTIE